ncbi:related to small nuclear ribonucleoprotein B [Cephalotrichum gorgonifer]|uniref:Sm protein B n=1 Tax=Cephalotrichum gorgonifer TaxID=2041049 RepID=A0AAE8SQP5_9PEZI|nr:related to small nuclear ribonucleoprotein B [Cephalotrichum gorgonifer]
MASSLNKQGKMAGYINWRMRVTLLDGRQMTGQMLAFDKHMNLVLADTEEFRKIRSKQGKAGGAPGAGATQTIETEAKRTLGLTIVRGAHIVSLSVESPPPADPSARLGKAATGGIASTLAAGQGVARAAGRGAAIPPPSLAGPAAGVGGAAPPPGFPPGGFPPVPGFGRGAPPPGFPGAPGAFPPGGFAPNAPFPPPGFPQGGPPAPGFQPPPRR